MRPDEDNVEELAAQYADRLIAGEEVQAEEILAEHPSIGTEIVEHLDAFISCTTNAGGQSPRTLGDYTLHRQIGRGGMGVVYDAWENSMDRRVALKVLPSGIAADTKLFTRFCREAKLAGKLHHPNVVPVFGMGIKEDTPHYAMLTGQSPPRLPLS